MTVKAFTALALIQCCNFPAQIAEMMRWADKDGDGKVGFDEFSALMSSTARGHS